MRRVLVRILNNNGAWAEVGYTIASEAIRRPITFPARRAGQVDSSTATLDGIALIGEGGKEGYLSIEPIAKMLGQNALKIARTPELLWLPVAAHRLSVVDLWTIECVPLVAWFNLAQLTDEAVLTRAGVDPATGEILLPPPGERCDRCGGYGRVAGLFGHNASDAVACPTCHGSGKAPR